MPLKVQHALTCFGVIACTTIGVVSLKHNVNELKTINAIANIHLKSSAYSKDEYAPTTDASANAVSSSSSSSSDSSNTDTDKLHGQIGVYASVGQTIIYKYVVGKGDTLQSIANLLHTPVTTITDMNNRQVTSVEPDDQLLIHVLKSKTIDKLNKAANGNSSNSSSTSDSSSSLSSEIDNLLKDTKKISSIDYANDNSIYSSSGNSNVKNVDSKGNLLSSNSSDNLAQFKAHGYTGNESVGTGYDAGLSAKDIWAKHWIASHESSNRYTARNGRYIGKYQLDENYLKGDWSPANQEKVATQYMKSRYGTWTKAQQFWAAHNWW